MEEGKPKLAELVWDINISVALSEIIFCNTFPLYENGGRQ